MNSSALRPWSWTPQPSCDATATSPPPLPTPSLRASHEHPVSTHTHSHRTGISSLSETQLYLRPSAPRLGIPGQPGSSWRQCFGSGRPSLQQHTVSVSRSYHPMPALDTLPLALPAISAHPITLSTLPPPPLEKQVKLTINPIRRITPTKHPPTTRNRQINHRHEHMIRRIHHNDLILSQSQLIQPDS